jgi:hypothetical protein
MTLDERLKYCRICENRKLNPAIGLVCSLTNEKPAFEGTCPSIKIDQPEADRLVQLERDAKSEEAAGGNSMERKGLKMGVVGGVLMIVASLVWFFVGLAANRIFFYPIALFGMGVYGVIKGIADGNVAGGKN